MSAPRILYTPEQIAHASWYVRAYREALRKAHAGILIQMNWAGAPLDESGLRAEFITALFRRIDSKAGVIHTGRKWQPDYQISLRRDARRVYDRVNNRVIVRQFETPEIRKRFGHLLTV